MSVCKLRLRAHTRSWLTERSEGLRGAPMSRIQIGNLVATFAFVASAMLQLNDPDPIAWVALYLAAAGACIAWHRGHAETKILTTFGAMTLLWAIGIVSLTELDVGLWQAVSDWQMKEGGSEEIREIGGLLLVTVWMIVLARQPHEPPREVLADTQH